MISMAKKKQKTVSGTTQKGKKRLPFEINPNEDVKSQLNTLLSNPLVPVEEKKNWLRDHFNAGYLEGTYIPREEIIDILERNNIKVRKSPTGVKHGKKAIKEGQQTNLPGTGEGELRGQEAYRWFLHRHGIDIPKGMEIHHISGDHDDNSLENLALIYPKSHSKLHSVLGTDIDNFKENLGKMTPEQRAIYFKEYGGIPLNEMPKYKELTEDVDSLYNKLFETYERGNFQKPLADKKGFVPSKYQPGLFDPTEFNMSAERIQMESAFIEFKKSKRKV